jgi:hypothetical protein
MKKWMAMGAGMLLAGGVAQAADITWGSVSDYSSASDVSTAGALIEAINACGSAGAVSPVINGVQFTANTDLLDSDATTTFFYGDTGDDGYDDLLNTLDYGSSQFSVGGGQLENGKEYFIQIWYVDERSSQDARAMQFGDGNGNLSAAVNDQYVTGIFTADGTSQTITISGVSGVTPHITAYQVRDMGSPVVTLSTTAGDTVTEAFAVTVNFSESVTGLTADDFEVINGVASGVSGSGSDWSVLITPTSNGDVSVSLPAGAVIDADEISNLAANTILATYVAAGSEQAVPTLSTPDLSVDGDFTVEVEFSEEVTGLTAGDFVVTNGDAVSVAGSGTSYLLVVSPNFGGDVTVSLPKNSVTDTDGDGLQNVASDALVVAYYQTVTVSSFAELLPYLPQDNINCTMSPGTYTIAANGISSGSFPYTTTINGSTYNNLLLFSGNNCTYDFAGVTVYISTGLWHEHDYGTAGVYQLQTTGNNNVIKNLTMIDDGSVDDDPKDGCINIVMDGSYNRIEGFHITSRGSYPYGYGDCFGKGGGPVISHNKHSGFLIRGYYNHAKNCTLIHRSYGHGMFMQAASYPTIEGCYVEGEMRSTDDMWLEEGTGSPADNVDFQTVWGDDDDDDRYGYTLPRGFMKSTGEGGIRAYNAGNTVIDGVEYSRGTDNPTIINNTVVNMRTGVTLTHATGTKYVAGCKTIGCERGYAIGSGIIENCSSDVQYGPAFGVDYDSNRGITADITILPYTGEHYNGSRHFAYIFGSDHNLTFRGLEAFPDQELEINVGGDLRIESSTNVVENRPASDIIINNYTGYPLILDDASSGNEGFSIGTIADAGSGNSFTEADWSVTSNITFYGEASQSSTSDDALASLAMDQNTSGDSADGSVTYTESEAQPWWQLDLKEPVEISELRIWNRDGTTSVKSRLSNYDVTILDADYQPVWTSYQSSYPDAMVSLSTGSVIGQYVLIQLRDTDVLSLAEVQVFGAVVDDSPEVSVFSKGMTFAPVVSSLDLAQTQYLSSSATGENESAEHAQLFNGLLGNEDTDSSDAGEVALNSENTVTVTLDTSIHTNGYDLTGITTYFGGDTDSGGRANQGYEIILTYVDGATETLAGPACWMSNDPVAFYWTKVEFTEASYGVLATGVKSVTFDITEEANAGGVVVAREIDLFGTPSRKAVHYLPGFIYGGTAVSNGYLETAFSGEPGEVYSVEWASSLTGSWQTVTQVDPLESSPFYLSIPVTNSTGFYRIKWNP